MSPAPPSGKRLAKPTVGELLANPDAFLGRSDLCALGLERRAVDAVFRGCPVVVFEGYKRQKIRVKDYRAYIERSTYRDGERVRP
jgi:hypothetical protein